jgi:hypothetical protein
MRLAAQAFLDDRARLEKALVGCDLSRVAADLAATLPARAGSPAGHEPGAGGDAVVKRLLGPHLETVLQRGLAHVPRSVLEPFLERPHLLLDLQGLVVGEGGDYWHRLMASAGEGGEIAPPPLDEIVARLERFDREALGGRKGPGPRRPARQLSPRAAFAGGMATMAALLLPLWLLGQAAVPQPRPDDARPVLAQAPPARARVMPPDESAVPPDESSLDGPGGSLPQEEDPSFFVTAVPGQR